VEKLSAAVKQAIAQSQPLIDKWHSYAGEIKGTTPAEFQAFIKAESAKWLEVVRQSNIKLD
jgi:tripartite-type tricarboxylate transporter receptor subunit TctC